MRFKEILFTVLIFVLAMAGYSQNCSDYHIEKGRWTDESYLYSRQSRSALFKPAMTSEFSIIVYGGEDYYVNVTAQKELGKIRIRIKEDNENKNVLYDNADYEYEDYFFFRNKSTRNLIIEVSSLKKGKQASPDKLEKKYCLGVLIQFRVYQDKNTKTGF